MRTRLPLLAVATCLAVAVGGCGTKVFKQGELQDSLSTELAKQAGTSPGDIDVSCPDDAEVKKDKTFTCETTDADGNKETLTVTPTDDKGNFHVNTLHVAELQRQLVQQLSANAGVDPANVKVNCPDVIEARKGRKFDCELTAPNGDKVRVVVTLTDARGGFTAIVPKNQ
jgi:hypothetical protein